MMGAIALFPLYAGVNRGKLLSNAFLALVF
jgi:hypothetical protein